MKRLCHLRLTEQLQCMTIVKLACQAISTGSCKLFRISQVISDAAKNINNKFHTYQMAIDSKTSTI